MSKLKVGIIGTGFGALIQAPGFSMHPECEVVALAGVARPGRAAEQAAKLGIPHAYDDWQAMLAQEELDLVSVVSAPHLHHPMTIAALERRIPVLCEKPMALNLAEAQSMADAAQRRGLVGAIDFEFRHNPVRTRFKEMVQEGFLGDLVHFNLTMSLPAFERHVNRPMGWLWREENGGGMLGAIGSHLIDTLRWLLGDIDSVAARLSTHVAERQGEPVTADDTFAFLCQMAGSKATGIAQMLMYAHHGFDMRLEAFGTKGTLVLLGDQKLLAGRAGQSLEEVPLPARFDLPGVVYPENPDKHIPPFMVMVDNLVQAIRRTGAPGPSREYATFADGAAVQAVLDAIRQAHREERWVKVQR